MKHVMSKRNLVPLALLLSGAVAAHAAAPPAAAVSDLETFCRTAHCRHDVSVRLRKPDGSVFEKHSALMPPAVQRGLIGVLPGETVRFVPILVDGKFHGWREPATLDAPDTPVFSIRLEQADGKPDMVATLTNSGARTAKLRMGLVTLNSDQPHPTSSCPVLAGIGSMEMWPEPVFMLLVSELTFVDAPTSAEACN